MRKFVLFLATGLGTGYTPVAPGTAGSLLGLLIFWPLHRLPPWIFGLTLFAAIFLAVWISTIAETLYGKKDCQKIVIDEVIGIWVALAFVPLNIVTLVSGFVLFRLFDIWKPFPARLAQDRLPAGWGIVGDDVMAGIYANLVLQVVTRLL